MGFVNFAIFIIFLCPLAIHQIRAVGHGCQDLQHKCSGWKNYCSYDNIKEQCPLTCKQCENVPTTSLVILVTSSHRLNPTQSVEALYTVATGNTGKWNNQNPTVRATASRTVFTQAHLLMVQGIIWSYFLSR